MSRQVLTAQAIELDAFGRLMRAHTVLRRELDAEVLRPRGLTLSDFETLMHLYRARESRLRRVDLVERLMLSASGVTRLLEGLQAAGLVENLQCDDDARVTWARLTPAGEKELECVGAHHARHLRTLFSEGLSDDEVEQLSALLGKLPGVGAGNCAG